MGIVSPPYAAFADALPNQVCVLDADGVVVFVNAAWRRFASENGHCGGTFVGMNYVALCEAAEGAEQEDARLVGRGLRAILNGELDTMEHVYPCHAPDSMRWFRVQASRFGAGVIVQHVPAADPAQAEADLVHVLSHVAHELRTPLGAIVGYSDLLNHLPAGVTEHQREGFTAAIHESSVYLSGVVEDMMELARSRRSRDVLTLNEAPCDLGRLLADAAGMVGALAANRRITVAVDEGSAGRLPPRVTADRRRLMQVLVNLLTNAIKFSPPGSTVTCRLERSRCGGLRIEIADHGAGMAPDEIPVAFSAYGRTASARKGAVAGLGLGLPLSKALTELHGGSLTLDSAPGRGTKAIVNLPAWRSLATTAAAAATTATAPEAGLAATASGLS